VPQLLSVVNHPGGSRACVPADLPSVPQAHEMPSPAPNRVMGAYVPSARADSSSGRPASQAAAQPVKRPHVQAVFTTEWKPRIPLPLADLDERGRAGFSYQKAVTPFRMRVSDFAVI
jgi:hypothetical protein